MPARRGRRRALLTGLHGGHLPGCGGSRPFKVSIRVVQRGLGPNTAGFEGSVEESVETQAQFLRRPSSSLSYLAILTPPSHRKWCVRTLGTERPDIVLSSGGGCGQGHTSGHMPNFIYARSRFAEPLATIFPVERENLESPHCSPRSVSLDARSHGQVLPPQTLQTLRLLPRAGSAPLPARRRVPKRRRSASSETKLIR